jgi:hypothetical protein
MNLPISLLHQLTCSWDLLGLKSKVNMALREPAFSEMKDLLLASEHEEGAFRVFVDGYEITVQKEKAK